MFKSSESYLEHESRAELLDKTGSSGSLAWWRAFTIMTCLCSWTHTYSSNVLLWWDGNHLSLFSDLHRLHSGCSQPLPAAAHLHHRACAHVHRSTAGRTAATRLCHRGQLLLQHAPQPEEPVLHHQVLQRFHLGWVKHLNDWLKPLFILW